MARHRVAILIPAYNEEKTITKIINETKKYGKIIVIDDGSNDKTAYLSKKSGALVESHSKNFGYDALMAKHQEHLDKIEELKVQMNTHNGAAQVYKNLAQTARAVESGIDVDINKSLVVR